MEVEGMIIHDLPMQEGVSKAGRPWKKKEWVLETAGTYPKKVKFTVFGDRVDYLNFEMGKSYAVTVEIDSREFQGRWYTDINCLGARPLDGVQGMGNFGANAAPGFAQPAPAAQPMGAMPAQPAAPAAPAATPFGTDENNTDDLPF